MRLPLALLGAFWLLLPRGVPGKPLALLLWLPLLWPDARSAARTAKSNWWCSTWGRGCRCWCARARHALLYDTGPAVPRRLRCRRTRRGAGAACAGRAPAGSRRDQPWRQRPCRRLRRRCARCFRRARSLAPAGVAASRRDAPCVAGQRWQWDGVRFRFLHPPPHFPYLGNEASCVLRIDTRARRALLTGDIGEVIERELVRRDAARAARRRGAGGRTTAAAARPIRLSSLPPARACALVVGGPRQPLRPSAGRTSCSAGRPPAREVLDTADGGALPRVGSGRRRAGSVRERAQRRKPRLVGRDATAGGRGALGYPIGRNETAARPED